MPYLPEPYKRFQGKYPGIIEMYEKLALACHEGGALSEKERRLVKLGIAMGQQSEGAIKSHARRLLEEGASAEEVRHAILLALTTAGFPAMVGAFEWLEEVIEARQS